MGTWKWEVILPDAPLSAVFFIVGRDILPSQSQAQHGAIRGAETSQGYPITASGGKLVDHETQNTWSDRSDVPQV